MNVKFLNMKLHNTSEDTWLYGFSRKLKVKTCVYTKCGPRKPCLYYIQKSQRLRPNNDTLGVGGGGAVCPGQPHVFGEPLASALYSAPKQQKPHDISCRSYPVKFPNNFSLYWL